jgi:hypothetical protein
MKKLVILFLLISGAAVYSYTPPDSCLKLVWPNDYDYINNTGTSNPDSVQIDTCLGSPTFGRLFANRYFRCRFNTYIFDSVIQKNVQKTVNDISALYPNIKNQFLRLDSIYGPIYFVRESEGMDWPDSAYFLSGRIDLFFENYQNIDSIVIIFSSSLDSLMLFGYANRAVDPVSVDEKINSEIILIPNPASDYIEITAGSVILSEAKEPFIRICNILGVEQSLSFQRKLESSSSLRIDVSHLYPGVYIVQINTQSGTISKKLIIQR